MNISWQLKIKDSKAMFHDKLFLRMSVFHLEFLCRCQMDSGEDRAEKAIIHVYGILFGAI